MNKLILHLLAQSICEVSKNTLEILDKTKDRFNLAYIISAYSIAYSAGANRSLLPHYVRTACGRAYMEIDTERGIVNSIVEQLTTARIKGCFALVVEIVRSEDGRVMPAHE